MKHFLALPVLLTFFAFAGCEKTDPLEEAPQLSADYAAFYVGYGGGWGVDVWYRITDATVDKYAYLPSSGQLPEGGYTNPTNWTVVTDTEFIGQLRELESDFPAAAFAGLEQSACPEVAYDGTCVRVGYGSLNPAEATIWFRNGADDPIATAYLGRVNEVLYGE